MKPAEQNLAAFLAWTVGKTDAHYREMVMPGQLSRQEIARECGFAKAALFQNPTLLYTAVTRAEQQVILWVTLRLRRPSYMPHGTRSGDMSPLARCCVSSSRG